MITVLVLAASIAVAVGLGRGIARSDRFEADVRSSWATLPTQYCPRCVAHQAVAPVPNFFVLCRVCGLQMPATVHLRRDRG